MNKPLGNILEGAGIMRGLCWNKDKNYDSFILKAQSYVVKAKEFEQTYLNKLAIAIKLSLSFKNYYSNKYGLKKGWKNNKSKGQDCVLCYH